jgi:hypothetical protein
MSSSAKVLVADVRHGARVKAIGVDSAKAANATIPEATDVSGTEATHVASAKAAHVASAAHAATTVSATAASCLCARGKQASGQYRGCQYRYHSSFHDFLHLEGRIFRLRSQSDLGALSRVKGQSCDMLEMRIAGRVLH